MKFSELIERKDGLGNQKKVNWFFKDIKRDGQVLWHKMTKIYHHNLEISPKILVLLNLLTHFRLHVNMLESRTAPSSGTM